MPQISGRRGWWAVGGRESLRRLSGSLGSGGVAALGLLAGEGGDLDHEHAAFAVRDRAGDGDAAAVALGDVLDQGEADAAAADLLVVALAAEEALEDAIEVAS